MNVDEKYGDTLSSLEKKPLAVLFLECLVGIFVQIYKCLSVKELCAGAVGTVALGEFGSPLVEKGVVEVGNKHEKGGNAVPAGDSIRVSKKIIFLL